MIGRFVARSAGALEAFVAGRRFGQEWAQGHRLRDEIARVREREPRTALVLGAVTLGGIALGALARREMLVAAGAGWFIGSGGLERVRKRLGVRARGPNAAIANRAFAGSIA